MLETNMEIIPRF